VGVAGWHHQGFYLRARERHHPRPPDPSLSATPRAGRLPPQTPASECRYYEERPRTFDWKARAERVRAEREEVAALAIKWGVPLPWGPYQAAARSCFKCGERIVVYIWRGHAVRSEEPPPTPRPHTLCQRTTAQSGEMRYWLNICPACMVTQGDNYLYDEGNGSGPPPFAHTWKGALPTVPGGPLPARPQDDPPGGGPRRSSGMTLNAALDILTGGGRRGGWTR
jgi:hypothetical protein